MLNVRPEDGGMNGGTPAAGDAVAIESVFEKLEASAGLEPAVEVLQTSALPLG